MLVRPILAACAVAASVLVAAPAQAGSIECASDREFRAVEIGWSKARVHRVLDTEGRKFTRNGPLEARRYLACAENDLPHFVIYRNQRVSAKA